MGGAYNLVNLALYHYAGNNPVRYTDPDGRQQYGETDDTAQGRLIHAIILQRYRDDNFTAHVEGNYTSISTILAEADKMDKGQGRTDFGLRPDIWNVTTGAVYEIKPTAEGAKVAKAQCMLYVMLLLKAGEKAYPGLTDETGINGFFLLGDKRVDYWCPDTGVILYSIGERQTKKIPVPEIVGTEVGVYALYKAIRAIAVSLLGTPAAGAAAAFAP